MKRFLAAAVLASLMGAVWARDRYRAPPIVVIDYWWSRDYEKGVCDDVTRWYRHNRSAITQLGCDVVTSCVELMPRFEACADDPDSRIAEFFGRLAGQFASDTRCDGVQVAQYDGPRSPSSPATTEAMTRTHSTLIVDFIPGSPKQSWTLLRGDSYMTDDGTAKEIAASVCNIVTNQGAKLVQ